MGMNMNNEYWFSVRLRKVAARLRSVYESVHPRIRCVCRLGAQGARRDDESAQDKHPTKRVLMCVRGHIAFQVPGLKRDEHGSAGIQGRGRWEIPEKTRRPASSSGTIPTKENPGANPPEIKPGSPRLGIIQIVYYKQVIYNLNDPEHMKEIYKILFEDSEDSESDCDSEDNQTRTKKHAQNIHFDVEEDCVTDAPEQIEERVEDSNTEQSDTDSSADEDEE
ncbi:hypothetical protein PR048_024950 [Dryococelus australis]|uniref:Uncharacterized protein n=1 Tax=Dryococelus australis TaxID=614101 RepID=A0ABQ9GQ38_9NEOP|nr:hypothetical protein PR048_024950 [Dryococelus australis]